MPAHLRPPAGKTIMQRREDLSERMFVTRMWVGDHGFAGPGGWARKTQVSKKQRFRAPQGLQVSAPASSSFSSNFSDLQKKSMCSLSVTCSGCG